MLQSTLPKWVETSYHLEVSRVVQASIHSTQMGRDILGERERLSVIMLQSTLPKWVETPTVQIKRNLLYASIHSTQMGRDSNYAHYSSTYYPNTCHNCILFGSKIIFSITFSLFYQKYLIHFGANLPAFLCSHTFRTIVTLSTDFAPPATQLMPIRGQKV